MSTFYRLLLLIGRENLYNHELIFLASHCVILDHGLQLSLDKSPTRETTASTYERTISKDTLSEEIEIQLSSTYPFMKSEDNSICMVVLPPKWKLTDLSTQAYSVNYVSPLSNNHEYKGPKCLSFRALVIADQMMLHLTDSQNPENLISFKLELSTNSIKGLADSLKALTPSTDEPAKAEALYMELYKILHSHLSSSNKHNTADSNKSKSTTTPKTFVSLSMTDTTSPVIQPPLLYGNVQHIYEPDSGNRPPTELVGPDDPIFRLRSSNPSLRRPLIDIEPIDPVNTLIDNEFTRIQNRRDEGLRWRAEPRSWRDEGLRWSANPRRWRNEALLNRPAFIPMPRYFPQDMDNDDDTFPGLGGPRNPFL